MPRPTFLDNFPVFDRLAEWAAADPQAGDHRRRWEVRLLRAGTVLCRLTWTLPNGTPAGLDEAADNPEEAVWRALEAFKADPNRRT